MALPDSSGSQTDAGARIEERRRMALLKTFFSAFLIAGWVGLPGWYHQPHPSLVSLSMSLVPAAVASCLLVAFTVTIPSLFPEPVLTPTLALACAAMHVVVMLAFATVLSIRPDAMMGVPSQMAILARWSQFPLEGVALLVEAAVLATYAGLKLHGRRNHPPREA
jgi:hypothetical protein